MIKRFFSGAAILGIALGVMSTGFSIIDNHEAHRSVQLAAATTHGITSHSSLGGSPRRSKSWQHPR